MQDYRISWIATWNFLNISVALVFLMAMPLRMSLIYDKKQMRELPDYKGTRYIPQYTGGFFVIHC